MGKLLELNDSTCKTVINKIINVINKNGTVIIPTDTVYGFFAPYNNIIIEKKIRDIKIRDEKPFILLVNSIKMLEDYSTTIINERILKLLPCPLTLIVNSNNTATHDNSLAMRFPNSRFLIELISSFKMPCLSTSANISGKPIPDSKKELIKLFKDQVDLIVTQDEYQTTASTILDIREKPYKILRQGEILISDDILN